MLRTRLACPFEERVMAKFPSSRFPNISGLSNGFYFFEVNDALWPNLTERNRHRATLSRYRQADVERQHWNSIQHGLSTTWCPALEVR
jgi:hypothetical protein